VIPGRACTDRGEAMARRIVGSALRAGTDPAPIVAAFLLGEAKRIAAFRDDQHPDYLHGGRAAVILLEDVRVSDPATVAAAAAAESEDARVRITPAELAAVAGADAGRLLAELPVPAEAGDRLTELLVVASEPARLAAVTERLDHARHLHLRAAAGWAAFHETITRSYLPVAQRTHPVLARRLERWAYAFRERRLGGKD
jgi:hypothetical protein